MSIGCSMQEAIFNFYIAKKRKDLIENIIGSEVGECKLEYYRDARKIDIFSVEKKFNREIYIETQLNSCENTHYIQVKKIVDMSDLSRIVIWIARDFNKIKFYEAIVNYIKKQKKVIDFYAVTINKELITYLEELNNMHTFRVIDNLDMLGVGDELEMFDKFISRKINEKAKREEIQLNRRERNNKLIIDGLRENTKFLNFFKEKRTLDVSLVSYGLGKMGIDIGIVFKGKNDESYVQVRFNIEDCYKIYFYIKQRKSLLCKKLNNDVIFDDEDKKIKVYVDKDSHKFKKIDDLVFVTEKLTKSIINYTMYFNKPELWSQNPDGII